MALNPGDIAIVEIVSQGSNGGFSSFQFVPLVDIPANTQIGFTGASFNANGSIANEGNANNPETLTWTAPSSGLKAGTVVTVYTNTSGLSQQNPLYGAINAADQGTVTGGIFQSPTGYRITAFTGTLDSNPTLLFSAALNATDSQSAGWNNTASTSSTSDSQLPTTLQFEVAFDTTQSKYQNGFGNPADGIYYTGSTTGTKAQILSAIETTSNWTYAKASGSAEFDSTKVVGNFSLSTPPSITSDALGTHPTGTDVNSGTFTFTVTFNEAVTVTQGSGNNILSLALNNNQTAAYTSTSSDGKTLTFTYTVGNNDDVSVLQATGFSPFKNGVTITDAATNTLSANITGFQQINTQTQIDTKAPTASSIGLSGTSPNNAQSDTFTVTFSEAVIGVDKTDFTAVGTGGVQGTVASVSGSGTTYTVTVNGVMGTGTLGLNLNSSSTGITDLAGNAIKGGFTGQTYTVDQTPPTITGVTLDKASYKLGDTVTATIQLDAYDGHGAYTLGAGSTIDGQTLRAVPNGYNSTNNTLTATFVAYANVTQVTNSTVADNITVNDGVGNTSTAATSGIANTTIDTIAPTVASATVNGNTLVVAFDESGSGLNNNPQPLTAEFQILNPVTQNNYGVNSYTYNASNKILTLTLAKPVAYGDTVLLYYTPQNRPQDIQDNAGNLLGNIESQRVTNTTPAPTPSITSAAYDPSTGKLVVTGTNFTGANFTASIDPTKLTIAGDGGTFTPSGYALVTADSSTQFTVQITAADQAAVDALLDKNGTAGNTSPFTVMAATGYESLVPTASASAEPITVLSSGAPSLTPTGAYTSPAMTTVTVTPVQIDGRIFAVADTPDSSTFSGIYNGGTLNVSLTNYDSAHDVLGIANTTFIQTSGSNVSYNGTTIGTITADGSQGFLQVNLNGSAGDTSIEALINAITIADPTASPITNSRDVAFTLTDAYGASTTFSDVVNYSQAAITIGRTNGGLSDQTTDTDRSTAKPFANVTIGDNVAGDTITATVSFVSADGRLSTLGNGSTATNGGTTTWTDTGTAGAVQADLQALVFTPTAHEVAAGTTQTTNFSIGASGTAGSASDSKISVVTTDLNDRPVLDTTKTVALTAEAQADTANPNTTAPTDATSVSQLVSLTGQPGNVTDPDFGAVTGIAITKVDTTYGTWWYQVGGKGGWSPIPSGLLSAREALVLTPADKLFFQSDGSFHGTVPNALTFVAWDQTDGAISGQVLDTTQGGATASTSSASDSLSLTLAVAPPVIGGTGASATTDAAAAVTPFAGATVSDLNTTETVTLTVTFSGANGMLGNLGGGSLTQSNRATTWTDTGTASAVQNDLRALTFTPTPHETGIGLTVPTTFTIGASGAATGASDSNTVVTTTDVNYAPTASGITPTNPTYHAGGSAVGLFTGGTVQNSAGQGTEGFNGLTLNVAGVLNGSDETLTIDGTTVDLTNGASATTTNGYGVSTTQATPSDPVIVSINTNPTGTSAASASAIESLIDGITYANTAAGATSAGTRTITLTSLQNSGGTADGGQDTTKLSVSSNVTPTLDAPSVPALAAASDTGSSSSDGLTNINTGLVFTGTGTPDAQVELFDSGSQKPIGTGTIDSNGKWSITTTGVLSDGTYPITAEAFNAYGLTSAASQSTSVTVDTTPPIVTASADKPSVQATSSAGAAETFTAASKDVVDGSSDPITYTEQLAGGGTQVVHSGDTFAVGSHTIIASATDQAGNTGSAAPFSFTVTPLPSTGGISGGSTGSGSGSASGGSVILSSLDPTSQLIERLYFATLDRAADAGGLALYDQRYNANPTGRTLRSIAADMIGSPEFGRVHGHLNDRQFVEALYEGALGRPVEAAALHHDVHQLQNGTSRQALAVSVAESPEAISHLAGKVVG